MKFPQTVCKPGSYIEIVPLGLLARIQYNQNGLLEKIIVDDKPLSKTATDTLRKAVPQTIALKGGTTWVDGVFYEPDAPTKCGVLPQCLNDLLIKSSGMAFYAYNVDSKVTTLSGALAIRNWLSISKFNTLPSFIVQTTVSDETIESAIQNSHSPIEFPFLSGFYSIDGTNKRYVPLNLIQANVKSIDTFYNEEGFMLALIKTDNGSITVNYSDVIRMTIVKKSCILYEKGESANAQILACRNVNVSNVPELSNVIVCPTCMKRYAAPLSGYVQCDDPHCPSKMYPDVKRMLHTFRLSELPYAEFKEMIDDHYVGSLSDVLYLPRYKEAVVEVTLAEALRAVVPVSVCSDNNILSELAKGCENNKDTLLYYASNTTRLFTDLGINSIQVPRLAEWLDDDHNLSTLRTVLESVAVVENSVNEEKEPIFRGRRFLCTGKFLYGPEEAVNRLLASYGGYVCKSMEDGPNIVLVGSAHDGISGSAIKRAKEQFIPVLEENDFFESCSNLLKNLL